MIFPYGQERNSVRVLPWVTIAIILVNFFVHYYVISKNKELYPKVVGVGIKMIQCYRQHPYLILGIGDSKKESLNYTESQNKFLENFRKSYKGKIPDKDTVIKEQKVLNSYLKKLYEIKKDSPYLKWGFIPSKKSLKTSITYMFIHGGWFHLLGNLFLLYLVGPYVEDVWGKTMYGIAYIIIGILSAYVFAMHYPGMIGPLIGASGAISGILGAFLVKFWNTRIKFFYWFWFVFGTFKAPAWLILPIWFINEIISAKSMDAIYKHGGSVAHWAHIWGFVFGFLIAVILSLLKYEEKFVNKKYKEKFTYTNKAFLDYEEALKLKEDGKYKEAFLILMNSAKSNNRSTDVIELLWIVGLELKQTDEIKNIFIRYIEYELKTKRIEAAYYHYNIIIKIYPKVELNIQLSLILLKYLLELERIDEAEQLSHLIYKRTINETLSGFLVLFSETLLRLNTDYCEEVVNRTLNNIDVPNYKKDELKIALAEYIKNQNRQKKIKISVLRAIPISVSKETLVLMIQDSGKTTLALNKVQLISTVKIMEYKSKIIYLIDLFLDNPKSDKNNIRIIRIFSLDFNPVKFIPKAKTSGSAFKIFVESLLKYSEAKPYHGFDYLILKKVKAFASVEDYDNSLKENDTQNLD